MCSTSSSKSQFSSFPSFAKSLSFHLLNADAVVITPEGTSWNPHGEHYSLNEDTFTDCEGNMMDKAYIQNNLIGVVEDVPAINCANVNAV
jgi:hypothetical protein